MTEVARQSLSAEIILEEIRAITEMDEQTNALGKPYGTWARDDLWNTTRETALRKAGRRWGLKVSVIFMGMEIRDSVSGHTYQPDRPTDLRAALIDIAQERRSLLANDT